MFERDASLALSDARFLAEGKTFTLCCKDRGVLVWQDKLFLFNGQISS